MTRAPPPGRRGITASRDDVAHWVDRVAALAARAPLDAWEVRGEARRTLRSMDEGRGLEGVSHAGHDGVSLRAWKGDAVAYVHTTEPWSARLDELVPRAEALAGAAHRRGVRTFPPALAESHEQYEPSVKERPLAAAPDAIARVLTACREAALEVAPDAHVQATFKDVERRSVRSDSVGSWVETGYLHSGVQAAVTARVDGRAGAALEVRGGERGLDAHERSLARDAGAAAARHALEDARAGPAPAGRFRVLCDPLLTGILAHESFGHLAEYDLVASGWSLLRGRRGDELADPRLSIVDAPVPPPGCTGVAVPVDDEGTRGAPVRLLDRGRLAAFLHQRDSAPLERLAPTGNGRALDVRFPPLVRMRNTYFEPGDLSLDEAFELLGDGLYLCGGRGGTPSSDGSFLFTSQRGYLVEGGRIVRPVKGPALSGNILEYLPRVAGLTREVEIFTSTFGGCGKFDQAYLHVGFGGPHLLVDEVLVGGGSVDDGADDDVVGPSTAIGGLA